MLYFVPSYSLVFCTASLFYLFFAMHTMFFFSTPFYIQTEVFVCSVPLLLNWNTIVCNAAADVFRTIPVLSSKPKSAPLVSDDIQKAKPFWQQFSD